MHEVDTTLARYLHGRQHVHIHVRIRPRRLNAGPYEFCALYKAHPNTGTALRDRCDVSVGTLLTGPERHRLGYGHGDEHLMLVAIPEAVENCERVVVSAVRLHCLD